MDFRVFSLGANDELAKKIAERVGKPLGEIKLKTFADGEQHVQFLENLRGKHIFLVQSTNPPAENWMRLFVWLFLGLIIYFTYSRRHSVLAKQRAGQTDLKQ